MKLKDETKPIEEKSNNQLKATIIFNKLINERKKIITELYGSVDYNNSKFEHVGPTKDLRFDEYKDSKKHFDATRIIRLNMVRQRINKMSF